MRSVNLAFCLATLCLAACTQTGPYRHTSAQETGADATCEIDVSVSKMATSDPGGVAGETEVVQCPRAHHVSVRNGQPLYQLSYVEIDEQGILASRFQAEAAVVKVHAEAAAAKQKGTYVVVFIHGWHHNARAGDENVVGFHRALAALAKWQPDYDVRGVYIGWRGDSIAIPGVRYLTFWERKNTSDEVGRGGLYEFLMRLELSVKNEGSHDRNRLILVGHSFGASVAFNALAQLHMERLLAGVVIPEAGPRFHGYGDLTVLVNPAIEGMRYMPFQSALHFYSDRELQSGAIADFSAEDKPALLIVSSEGDWATRKTFPVARFFSTFMEAHRTVSYLGQATDRIPDYSEATMDRTTIGNVQKFNSHAMIRHDPQAKETVETCRRINADLLVQPGTITFPDSGIILTRLKEGDRSPYWHADISAEIIPDHTHIAPLRFVCWLNQLVDARR